MVFVANSPDQPPAPQTSWEKGWHRLKPRDKGLLIGVVLGLALVGLVTLIALVLGHSRQPTYASLEKPAPQIIFVYPTPMAPTPETVAGTTAPGPGRTTQPVEPDPGWLETTPLPPTPIPPTPVSNPQPPSSHPSTQHLALWFDAPETGPFTPADVDRAIARGTEYLWSIQKSSGEFPGYWDAKFPGGTTLLAVYALRAAGVPAADPRLEKALAAVIGVKDANYANYQRALRILAFLAVNPGRYGNLIREDLTALQAAQHKDGGWNYDKSETAGSTNKPDNSNSQFAVLALYEAQRAGLWASPETLRRSQDYWLAAQNADGGFAYTLFMRRPSYGSMTAAGFASLVLLDDALSGSRFAVGTARSAAPNQGLEWLNRQFAENGDLEWLGQSDGRDGKIFYGLYAVARAAHAGGIKYLGGKDWLYNGCTQLVKRQNVGGSWSGYDREGRVVEPETQTAFALLFLSKGLTPVFSNKLRYPGDWNLTPRDLRQLARWLTETRERPVTWQIVQAGSESLAADLNDAPLLYITGTGPVPLSPRDRQALRQYVRLGGTILAVPGPQAAGNGEANLERLGGDSIFSSGLVRPTATPGKVHVGPRGEIVMDSSSSQPAARPTSFAAGIKALPTATPSTWHKSAASPAAGDFAGSLRDQLDAVLAPLGFQRKPLPADHPLWNLIHVVPPMPGAEGWTDGVVWRAFLLPSDLGADWDQDLHKTKPISFHLATNLLVLATDGVGLLSRFRPAPPKALVDLPLPTMSGASAPVWPETTEPADLTVSLARHAGGWLAGEMALGRLAETAAKKLRINVGLQLGCDLASEISPSARMLWLSGTTSPRLSPVQWQNIKTFCRRDGFVVFNAAASASAFTEALLPELKKEFGENAVVKLPPEHPLVTGRLPAKGMYDLTRMGHRRPRARTGQPIFPLTAPQPVELYGLRLDGRLVGVFGPLDFTYGLAGGPATDIAGYTPEGSRQIAVNLLLAARLEPAQRETPVP